MIDRVRPREAAGLKGEPVMTPLASLKPTTATKVAEMMRVVMAGSPDILVFSSV